MLKLKILKPLFILKMVICFNVFAQDELVFSGSINTGVYVFHNASIYQPSILRFQGFFLSFKIGTEIVKNNKFNFRYSSFELFHEALTTELTYSKDQPSIPQKVNIGVKTYDNSVNSFSLDYSRLLYSSKYVEADAGFGPLINVFNSKNDKNQTTYSYGVFAGADLKIIFHTLILFVNIEMTHSMSHGEQTINYFGGYFMSLGIGTRK